ncbi:methyl-accepting chemotaxis protein [Vibrio sp. Of7-15]|uniref:methyl-accepting chemotaxis protein n=1 Tax=Vibrio sp. Of7-15 TaxID=2724879 RepID=UPI001EF2CB13|nr:methyl-accepting chemotaxis protein [Vibrio sp. Of7-15]MCG7495368.1 methyl-accepting chemotaxis protein [Vibrio sp. Of7-15]
MFSGINKSLTIKIAFFASTSMALVLVLGIGVIAFYSNAVNQQTNIKVGEAFDSSASSEIQSASATVRFSVENLLTPVLKNLDVIKSNLELSSQQKLSAEFLVRLFDATMQPQEADVFSGYMVYEKSTWPSDFEQSDIAMKAMNKNGFLAPFYFPDGKGGYDYVAMESFSNSAMNDNGERVDDWHLKPYETDKLFLMEPYYYEVPSRGKELITTISDSIKVNGELIGSVGFDLSLVRIQKLAEEMDNKLYRGTGRIIVGSWKGIVLADSDVASNVGKRVSEISGYVSWDRAKSASRDQELISIDGKTTAFSRVATTTDNPWIVSVAVPQTVLNENKQSFHQWLDEEFSHALNMGLLGGLIALLVGSLCMWVIARAATSSLDELIVRLKSIVQGEGDLTQRIEVSRRDESGQLGDIINSFLEKLQLIIRDISHIGSSVDDNSSNSREAASEAHQRLDTQTAELNTLTVAVHEMATTASEVANSALEASKAAQQAQEQCLGGVEQISSTTRTIENVYEALSSAEAKTQSLSDSGSSIESILAVIGSIAEQTNLLALNAAIEAARAGEQGRGFAVVADEVRVLAGRTQEATQEIKAMIEQLSSDTDAVVHIMRDSHEKVSGCVDAARHAEESFKGINTLIDTINMQNHQMASAAEEQSRVNDEINRNVTVISDMSNEANEIVSKTSSLSEELNHKVAELRGHLNKFVVD